MVRLAYNLTVETAARCADDLRQLLQTRSDNALQLDLSEVHSIDSVGAALLADFARRVPGTGRHLQIVGMQDSVSHALQLFVLPQTRTLVLPRQLGWAERCGAWCVYASDLLLQYALLCADVSWFTLSAVGQRRGMRWSQVGREMLNMGAEALGVVGLIALLIGGTVALQSAAQLRQFGASLFVADLLGVAITRELGPLITAIVVAGRSGAAVSAELGTMVVTEEIDALRTMGINPLRFLLVPKVLAISLTQPLLTVLANSLAIFGGFLVAVLYLDIAPAAFLERLQNAIEVKDVLTGLFKSLLFANLIVTLGALCGLRTRGGADAVGRSTTTSVVAAIFAIIVADAICSLVFYYGE